jgi:hypothetical protein
MLCSFVTFPAGTVLQAGLQTLSVTFTPTDTTDYTTAMASVTLCVGQSCVGPTWSETQANEDMAAGVVAFQAAGTPVRLAHVEAGGSPSVTTPAISTLGANLLVAWVATSNLIPTQFSDNCGANCSNTWQALPVYSNGAQSNGRFFYAYNPNVGTGHTFTLTGDENFYPSIAVSAWSGMVNNSSVYQNSTGAVNSSTESLSTGQLAFSGSVLLITGWATDNAYLGGLAVNGGFTILDPTAWGAWELISHAYLIVGPSGGPKVTPTITWPTPSPITYGAALGGAQLNATATAQGSVVQGTFIYTPPAGTVLGAGSHQALSVSFVPNDTVDYTNATYSVYLNVNQAPLTITASNGTMTVGGTVPTITASYTGFVNGDTSASLSTPPACSTTATSSSSAGNYPSTCSGAVDSNYAITYTPGSVIVNPASVSVGLSSSSNSVTYGTPVTFTATVTGGTGTVTFYDQNGSVTLGAGTLNSSGVATLTISTLVPGSHSITAVYNGNTSTALGQTVNRNKMTVPSYCSPL